MISVMCEMPSAEILSDYLVLQIRWKQNPEVYFIRKVMGLLSLIIMIRR